MKFMFKLIAFTALLTVAACGSSNKINNEIDADEGNYSQSQKRILISPHSGRVISK